MREARENPFGESFSSRRRDELLGREPLAALRGATVLIEEHRVH